MTDSMDVDKQPTTQASGSVAKGKVAAGNKDEPRFVVKKVGREVIGGSLLILLTYPTLFREQWNAVALWAWDIVVDNCAICRNHIMELC
jgi:hypothetical protein